MGSLQVQTSQIAYRAACLLRRAHKHLSHVAESPNGASCALYDQIVDPAWSLPTFQPWPCNGFSTAPGNPISFVGHPRPFHEFFRKVSSGQNVKIVVIGGSVAACGHVEPQGCWTISLRLWFEAEFPGSNVSVISSAQHSTTSSWAARCFSSLVREACSPSFFARHVIYITFAPGTR